VSSSVKVFCLLWPSHALLHHVHNFMDKVKVTVLHFGPLTFGPIFLCYMWFSFRTEHFMIIKHQHFFFLCILWSLIALKKSCSLTSQWCHKNNNLHNPKNTIQKILSLRPFYIWKRSPNIPFSYIISTYICNTIWYFVIWYQEKSCTLAI